MTSEGRAQSNLPLFKSISDEIKLSILQKRIRGGDKLPSIREASKIHGVSVITIKRAYWECVTEGIIVPVHGIGYFAARDCSSIVFAQQLCEVKELLHRAEEKAKRIGIQLDFVDLNVPDYEKRR